MPANVQVLLPNHLGQLFDYAVPEDMRVQEGDYVRVSFGKRDMPGVVWSVEEAKYAKGKLKEVEEVYAHLPPMQKSMRDFIEWVAWYTMSPIGAVLKMALPVASALQEPGARERPPKPNRTEPLHSELAEAQEQAADALIGKLEDGFSVTLLDGVTGSGKTEVYFKAIEQCISFGRQTLILLPEIALSVQWLLRFTERFGFEPVVWHSNITPAQRKHAWRAIVHGEAKVIVGARSGLFLPYRDLGLLIVDEEHDASYKQEDGVMYHARDMAVVRAHLQKIPLVLVSATPSIETWYNVKQEKYAALHLPARYADAQLPQVQLIDMREKLTERGAFLSQPLREALAQTLAVGEQSLLFLNRRGYAPLLLCRTCGYRFACSECSSWLVMHKNKSQLQCHHCGHTEPVPHACPSCKAEGNLHACGPGVERIAEEVKQLFPQARVAELTSEHTEHIRTLAETIEAMAQGDIDILIGTQIVAKGHHFEKLALVGVVDADLGLAGGDLRATERTYQLLHQLSGRAGRAQIAGRVLIQTFQPQQPVMQALAKGEREQLMELELDARKRGHWPPITRLAGIIIEGANEIAVKNLAAELARLVPRTKDFQVLGPAPAPLYRLRGKYRYRLLVRAERQVDIQQMIHDWTALVRAPSTIRVKVDIDPYSFY